GGGVVAVWPGRGGGGRRRLDIRGVIGLCYCLLLRRAGGGASPARQRTLGSSGERNMSTLLDFMRKLGSDAALAAAYEKDPATVLARAGLSAEEQRAMLSSDYASIKRLTGLVDGQFATNHIIKAY